MEVKTIRAKRSNRRAVQSGKRFVGQRFGLLLGIAAVSLLLVSALALWEQRGNRSAPPPAEPLLNKSIGLVNAAVVVVEYADFQCPDCRQFAVGAAPQLRQAYVETGQVRLVFRHLAYLGPESWRAAEAAECANEQGRFWDYHDKLFAEQQGENAGIFDRERLKRFAAELALDTAQFNLCLDSGQYQAKVQQEVAEADRLGVSSAPTFFVNGQRLEEGSNYQVLQTAVEAALKRPSGEFAPGPIGPGLGH